MCHDPVLTTHRRSRSVLCNPISSAGLDERDRFHVLPYVSSDELARLGLGHPSRLLGGCMHDGVFRLSLKNGPGHVVAGTCW